ncbi:MAG: MtrB/PioB family outer membrane beta-barrel protein, partial [Halieaceae bacterium]|nr:MtrB/PioB family outer membrane beta-barrel protein [Halieaceae bacterium]
LGGAYTSDDNYMFGEYNGLYNKGGTAIGNLQWQDFSGTGNYWQGYVSNIGLDTREGALTWGKPGKLSLSVGFDSQIQVSNDNGKTPFNGNAHQVLPQDWVSGS